MTKLEIENRLRREQNILDRIENVKRLIQMEYTLMTAEGARRFSGYKEYTRKDNVAFGQALLNELRDEIELQLLSIAALCYGSNPDMGEPTAMLEWTEVKDGEHASDRFHDAWDDCLRWNG